MVRDLTGMYVCGGAGPDSASLPLCLWSSSLLKAQQPIHLWATLVGAFKVTDTNGGPGGKDVPRYTNGEFVASCPGSDQNMLSLLLPICPALLLTGRNEVPVGQRIWGGDGTATR